MYRRYRLAGAIALAIIVSGCTGLTIGGRTLNEAFPDQSAAALIRAASAGDDKKMDALIKSGANVNYIGDRGLTPLHWVFAERNKRGVELLLKHGANPNIQAAEVDPLTWLAAGGDGPELLDVILRNGGDPNVRTAGGESALGAAVTQKRPENLRLLIEHGADVNQHSTNGYTAAMSAANLAEFEMLALMLDRGYSYDLSLLARLVVGRHVPANSEARQWQLKVIKLLEDRGVQVKAGS